MNVDQTLLAKDIAKLKVDVMKSMIIMITLMINMITSNQKIMLKLVGGPKAACWGCCETQRDNPHLHLSYKVQLSSSSSQSWSAKAAVSIIIIYIIYYDIILYHHHDYVEQGTNKRDNVGTVSELKPNTGQTQHWQE